MPLSRFHITHHCWAIETLKVSGLRGSLKHNRIKNSCIVNAQGLKIRSLKWMIFYDHIWHVTVRFFILHTQGVQKPGLHSLLVI